ncbi:MAG: hypothetical protein E7527_01575 [Ruminococcaceae bacterium]|nr:hypothetical protein [Oscillospiraceae bacterium]
MLVLPAPYEDELAYSVWSRYFVRSGYVHYRSVAEDLFANPNVKPNMEFCNALTPNVIHQIDGIETFISNHTMLNYYSAFLTPDKQVRARDIAYNMDLKSLVNVLPMHRERKGFSLKYCPLCVLEDREKLQETYWHRSHQIPELSICHRHKCHLLKSSISLLSNAPPALITAEECVDTTPIVISLNDQERAFSDYIIEVMQVDTLSKIPTPIYLHHKLMGTKYISPRGVKRYIELLSQDFQEFYKDMDTFGFGHAWQLEKMFSGYRVNPFEVSLLGFFLGIDATELVTRDITINTNHIVDFDNQILQLKAQGMNYRQISEKQGMAYDYCKVLMKNRLHRST